MLREEILFWTFVLGIILLVVATEKGWLNIVFDILKKIERWNKDAKR